VRKNLQLKASESGCVTLHRHKQETEQLAFGLTIWLQTAHLQRARCLTPVKHENCGFVRVLSQYLSELP